MAARTVVLEHGKRDFWVQSYLPEIARGMAVTIRHMFRFLTKQDEAVFTIRYPEERIQYPERYRGLHRLMLREDGQVRCVACMCCSTICPAECIHIQAAEHDEPGLEKYPRVFVIDELRCIVCGLCVEACPCDAIRMDSGVHCEPYTDRNRAFLDRNTLMKLGTQSAARQGGENSY